MSDLILVLYRHKEMQHLQVCLNVKLNDMQVLLWGKNTYSFLQILSSPDFPEPGEIGGAAAVNDTIFQASMVAM